jgi:hypothetical protein
MIRIGTALVFAVLAGAALGQATPAPQSGDEAPKAPPIVRGRSTPVRKSSWKVMTTRFEGLGQAGALRDG